MSQQIQVPVYDPNQLVQLPIQNLTALSKNLEMEIEQFSTAYRSLNVAYETLLNSSSVLDPLKKEEEGKEIYVPLTSSIYCQGELYDISNVLVDVGTGYFVPKTLNEAQEVLKRKATFVKTSMDQIEVRLGYQQQNVNNIQRIIQMKAQQ
jgi:prefoldin alpha subunit